MTPARVSSYDALIIAAALAAGCTLPLSEDLLTLPLESVSHSWAHALASRD